MARKKRPQDAPTKVVDGTVWFRNTFGPPHFLDKWMTAGGAAVALQFGFLRASDLPQNVMDAVREHVGRGGG